ncbi:LamG domain-containing protein, partial [Patescibacteria group bacterium]|nr:LamG domain-containing protein [Patescibacteria group bacterium]
VDVTTTAAVHTDPLTSARPALIGIRQDMVSLPFDGKIGFIRIFNYALPPAEHWSWHQRLRLNT